MGFIISARPVPISKAANMAVYRKKTDTSAVAIPNILAAL